MEAKAKKKSKKKQKAPKEIFIFASTFDQCEWALTVQKLPQHSYFHLVHLNLCGIIVFFLILKRAALNYWKMSLNLNVSRP